MVNVKVKVGFLYTAAYAMIGPLYNLGSGSWLARVNGAAAQTAAIQLHSLITVNIQLDPRYASSKHTTAPINHTRPSPLKHPPDVATRARKQTSDYSLILNLSTSNGWKAGLA